eukprot:430026-Pyramimonas_sp.AAC.1
MQKSHTAVARATTGCGLSATGREGNCTEVLLLYWPIHGRMYRQVLLLLVAECQHLSEAGSAASTGCRRRATVSYEVRTLLPGAQKGCENDQKYSVPGRTKG